MGVAAALGAARDDVVDVGAVEVELVERAGAEKERAGQKKPQRRRDTKGKGKTAAAEPRRRRASG